MSRDMILVVDVGSRENERLLDEIRALGVECALCDHTITRAALDAMENVKGVILNGGSERLTAEGREKTVDKDVCNAPIPVLLADYMGDAPWPEDVDERQMILGAFVLGLCGAQGTAESGA